MRLSRPTLILAAVVLFGACKQEDKAGAGSQGSSKSAASAAEQTASKPAQEAAKAVLPALPKQNAPALADEKAKEDAGKLFDGSSPAAGELARLAGTDEAAVPVPTASNEDKARADASLTAPAAPAVKLDDPSRAPAAPEAPKAGIMDSLKARKRAALETAAKLVTRTREAVQERIVEPVKAFAEKATAKAETLYVSAKQEVVKTYERAREMAAPVLAKVQEHVVEPVKAFAEKTADKAGTLYASAKQGVVQTCEKAKEAVAPVTEKVTEVASKVKTAVQERAAPVIAKVSETASQVKAAVSAKLDGTAKLAKGLFDGAAKRWQAWRGKDKAALEAKAPAEQKAGDL